MKEKISLKLIKNELNRNDSLLNSLKKNNKINSNEIILSLALSPNEETLLIATNFNNLYEISFSKIVILFYFILI